MSLLVPAITWLLIVTCDWETLSLLPPLLRSQIISDRTGRSLLIEQPVLFKTQKSGLAGWDESPGPPGLACPQGDLFVWVSAVFTHI